MIWVGWSDGDIKSHDPWLKFTVYFVACSLLLYSLLFLFHSSISHCSPSLSSPTVLHAVFLTKTSLGAQGNITICWNNGGVMVEIMLLNWISGNRAMAVFSFMSTVCVRCVCTQYLMCFVLWLIVFSTLSTCSQLEGTMTQWHSQQFQSLAKRKNLDQMLRSAGVVRRRIFLRSTCIILLKLHQFTGFYTYPTCNTQWTGM